MPSTCKLISKPTATPLIPVPVKPTAYLLRPRDCFVEEQETFDLSELTLELGLSGLDTTRAEAVFDPYGEEDQDMQCILRVSPTLEVNVLNV